MMETASEMEELKINDLWLSSTRLFKLRTLTFKEQNPSVGTNVLSLNS